MIRGLEKSSIPPGQSKPLQRHFGPESIRAAPEQHTHLGDAGAASTRWNCPGTANKRDSDPTQDYRKEYNATSCQTVLFPSPVPSPPSQSLVHGRDSSSQNPLSPRSLLAKRLHYKSREPLSPTYHPGFLTRWQERCFACTKVWHSKLLLKPISPGQQIRLLGAGWAHGAEQPWPTLPKVVWVLRLSKAGPQDMLFARTQAKPCRRTAAHPHRGSPGGSSLTPPRARPVPPGILHPRSTLRRHWAPVNIWSAAVTTLVARLKGKRAPPKWTLKPKTAVQLALQHCHSVGRSAQGSGEKRSSATGRQLLSPLIKLRQPRKIREYP